VLTSDYTACLSALWRTAGNLVRLGP